MTDLGQLAHEINVRLERKERSGDHRLAAGLRLLEARALVKADGDSWTEWVTQNIKQSPGNVRKVMALASRHEPEPPMIRLPAEAPATMTDEDCYTVSAITAQEAAFRSMAKAFNELAGMMAVAKRCAQSGTGWNADKASLNTAVKTADNARQIARNMLIDFINRTDYIANPLAVLAEDRANRSLRMTREDYSRKALPKPVRP